MPPQIHSLNENEQRWIAAQLEGARQFVSAFAPNENSVLSLSVLDKAFSCWLTSTHGGEAALANEIINFVGVAFGNVLVQELGFSWVIASDEFGSDIAVLALPTRGDVLIYPTNFVAKRWERKESEFLYGAFSQIQTKIRELRQQQEGTQEL